MGFGCGLTDGPTGRRRIISTLPLINAFSQAINQLRGTLMGMDVQIDSLLEMSSCVTDVGM